MDDKVIEQQHLRLVAAAGEVRHEAAKLTAGVDDLLAPLLTVSAKLAVMCGAPG